MATRKRTSPKKPNRRGSPEAVEKRRTARALNTLLSGRVTGGTRDLRTERRRKRLLEELSKGRGGRALKPIEILQHADQLLEMGESVTAIKKAAGARARFKVTSDAEDVVRRTQEAYEFDPRAWDVLGIDVAGGGAAADSEVSPAPKAARATRARKATTKRRRAPRKKAAKAG